MADLLFLSGGFPNQAATSTTSDETNIDGSAVFINESYLFFLNGSFPNQQSLQISGNETDSTGDANFSNELYKFYATFPSIGLQPITSNVPVLNRSFGWINGG